MTELELKIITKAVKIRMDAGEDIEDILNSYPKLTEEDKEQIRNVLKPVTVEEEVPEEIEEEESSEAPQE